MYPTKKLSEICDIQKGNRISLLSSPSPARDRRTPWSSIRGDRGTSDRIWGTNTRPRDSQTESPRRGIRGEIGPGKWSIKKFTSQDFSPVNIGKDTIYKFVYKVKNILFFLDYSPWIKNYSCIINICNS